jgi:formyltetrahydrofolate-dependent phosphoribosylglycinamide formyltransferase
MTASPAKPARLVVLISGSGSNLQALIEATQTGRLAAKIELVVSNRRAAFGLQRAEKAHIPTLYRPLKPYKTSHPAQPRQAYDHDLAQAIAPYQPDLIVLAGWMHIFSAAFLDHFPQKVVNLHPALPGQFPGAHAIEEAFAAYQQGQLEQSGCMVHYVIPEVDAGPVIKTAVVPFQPGDSLASYTERMHHAEHRLIVDAVGVALQ